MVEILSRPQATRVDSATLAAQTALLVATLVTAPVVRNLMVKNVKTIMHALISNVSDVGILVLGDADASATEIKEALQSTSQDYEDQVAYRDGQSTVRRVWDIQAIPTDGVVVGGSINWEVPWKLPPKGIPILKGSGLAIFIFNVEDAAFSNGPTLVSQSKVMGGWF